MTWSPLRSLVPSCEHKEVRKRLKKRYKWVSIAFWKVNCHKRTDYGSKEEEITGKGNPWHVFEISWAKREGVGGGESTCTKGKA